MAKSNKQNTKTRKRVFLFGFICIAVNFAIFYSLGNIWKEIYTKKIEKKELSTELVELKEEEKTLKVEVNKLNDPSYIAKYARERFYYSGQNEYIIKME